VLLADDDDRARDGREVAGLAAVPVVLEEFLDLPPDDRPLEGGLALPDPLFQDLPVDLGPLGAAPGGAGCGLGRPVPQDLEADQPANVRSREDRLVELNSELPDDVGGDGDHGPPPDAGHSIGQTGGGGKG
jgi:hypothetical protein